MGTSCCLSLAALYLLVVCALGHYARSIIDYMIERPPLMRSLFIEVISTIEWCSCTFELVVVADVYGKTMASVIMFGLLMWSSMTWGEATASPFLAIEAAIARQVRIRIALAAVLAMVLGAAVAPLYINWMWQLQHHCPTHAVNTSSICETAIREFKFGAVLTGIAVFVTRIIFHYTHKNSLRYRTAINAFTAAAAFFILQPYTGGQINPITMASASTTCPDQVQPSLVRSGGALIGLLGAYVVNRYYDRYRHQQASNLRRANAQTNSQPSAQSNTPR